MKQVCCTVPLPIMTLGREYCTEPGKKKGRSCLTKLPSCTIDEGFYYTYVNSIV